MKKHALALLCSFGVTLLLAQTMPPDSTVQIKQDTLTMPKPPFIKFESGLYLEGSIEMTRILNTLGSMLSYGAGIQYKSVFLGFEINEYIGETEETLIFPNTFSIGYRYGAIYFGTRLVNGKFFDLIAKFHCGIGDVTWIRTADAKPFIRDEFILVHPEISLAYSPVRNIAILINTGYKQMNDLKLSNLSTKDFNGLTFGIGLRCGIYQQ